MENSLYLNWQPSSGINIKALFQKLFQKNIPKTILGDNREATNLYNFGEESRDSNGSWCPNALFQCACVCAWVTWHEGALELGFGFG